MANEPNIDLIKAISASVEDHLRSLDGDARHKGVALAAAFVKHTRENGGTDQMALDCLAAFLRMGN